MGEILGRGFETLPLRVARVMKLLGGGLSFLFSFEDELIGRIDFSKMEVEAGEDRGFLG